MKTRNGFVSNSSSSSFVLIVEKNEFEKATKKLHAFYSDFIKCYLGYDKDSIKMFMGKELVFFNGVASSEDGLEMEGELEAYKTLKSLPKELREDAYEDDDGEGNTYVQLDTGTVVSELANQLKKMDIECIYESKGC